MGHAQQKNHSIYTDEFPLEVRDKAHKKIVEIINFLPDQVSVEKRINFNDKIHKNERGKRLFYYCLDKINFKQIRKKVIKNAILVNNITLEKSIQIILKRAKNQLDELKKDFTPKEPDDLLTRKEDRQL